MHKTVLNKSAHATVVAVGGGGGGVCVPLSLSLTHTHTVTHIQSDTLKLVKVNRMKLH